MNKLVLRRNFKCGLTGDNCWVAFDTEAKEEVLISEDKAYDLMAEEQAQHDEYTLRCERGY